jgi:hypothetical protein
VSPPIRRDELDDLFLQALSWQVTAFSIFLDGDRARILFHFDNEATGGRPSGGRSISRQGYHRLLDHLLSLGVGTESLADGETVRRASRDMSEFGSFDSISFTDGIRTRRARLAFRGGVRLPISFQYVVGQQPIRWFRIDLLPS